MKTLCDLFIEGKKEQILRVCSKSGIRIGATVEELSGIPLDEKTIKQRKTPDMKEKPHYTEKEVKEEWSKHILETVKKKPKIKVKLHQFPELTNLSKDLIRKLEEKKNVGNNFNEYKEFLNMTQRDFDIFLLDIEEKFDPLPEEIRAIEILFDLSAVAKAAKHLSKEEIANIGSAKIINLLLIVDEMKRRKGIKEPKLTPEEYNIFKEDFGLDFGASSEDELLMNNLANRVVHSLERNIHSYIFSLKNNEYTIPGFKKNVDAFESFLRQDHSTIWNTLFSFYKRMHANFFKKTYGKSNEYIKKEWEFIEYFSSLVRKHISLLASKLGLPRQNEITGLIGASFPSIHGINIGIVVAIIIIMYFQVYIYNYAQVGLENTGTGKLGELSQHLDIKSRRVRNIDEKLEESFKKKVGELIKFDQTGFSTTLKLDENSYVLRERFKEVITRNLLQSAFQQQAKFFRTDVTNSTSDIFVPIISNNQQILSMSTRREGNNPLSNLWAGIVNLSEGKLSFSYNETLGYRFEVGRFDSLSVRNMVKKNVLGIVETMETGGLVTKGQITAKDIDEISSDISRNFIDSFVESTSKYVDLQHCVPIVSLDPVSEEFNEKLNQVAMERALIEETKRDKPSDNYLGLVEEAIHSVSTQGHFIHTVISSTQGNHVSAFIDSIHRNLIAENDLVRLPQFISSWWKSNDTNLSRLFPGYSEAWSVVAMRFATQGLILLLMKCLSGTIEGTLRGIGRAIRQESITNSSIAVCRNIINSVCILQISTFELFWVIPLYYRMISTLPHSHSVTEIIMSIDLRFEFFLQIIFHMVRRFVSRYNERFGSVDVSEYNVSTVSHLFKLDLGFYGALIYIASNWAPALLRTTKGIFEYFIGSKETQVDITPMAMLSRLMLYEVIHVIAHFELMSGAHTARFSNLWRVKISEVLGYIKDKIEEDVSEKGSKDKFMKELKNEKVREKLESIRNGFTKGKYDKFLEKLWISIHDADVDIVQIGDKTERRNRVITWILIWYFTTLGNPIQQYEDYMKKKGRDPDNPEFAIINFVNKKGDDDNRLFIAFIDELLEYTGTISSGVLFSSIVGNLIALPVTMNSLAELYTWWKLGTSKSQLGEMAFTHEDNRYDNFLFKEIGSLDVSAIIVLTTFLGTSYSSQIVFFSNDPSLLNPHMDPLNTQSGFWDVLPQIDEPRLLLKDIPETGKSENSSEIIVQGIWGNMESLYPITPSGSFSILSEALKNSKPGSLREYSIIYSFLQGPGNDPDIKYRFSKPVCSFFVSFFFPDSLEAQNKVLKICDAYTEGHDRFLLNNFNQFIEYYHDSMTKRNKGVDLKETSLKWQRDILKKAFTVYKIAKETKRDINKN